ncbi:tRNA1(Val) (adenine(37)-N6)-methyltransferase [Oscillospiraceae bacterium LTW-04]|nr:methyltransferase [Oscillospiraceae bacterium MB24-C1]
MPQSFIPLTHGITAAISDEHRFTTDSVLLARFAAPRADDIVAELCCGCGVVTLLWFGEGEVSPSHVVGIELMAQAAALFSLSVEKNNLTNRINVICADLKDYKNIPALAANAFDLVVCNPPYFKAGYGGGARQTARQETDLDISDVCGAAGRALRYGGRFCVCFKPQRLPDLFEAMRFAGLEPKRIRPVLTQPGKAPHLFLVEARRAGNRQLDWLPALYLQNSDGTPSAEYREIYRMR